MAEGSLTGVRELEKALGQFSKSTERGILRRVAKAALQPMLEEAQQLAPVDEGKLRDSIVLASGPLTKRARRVERGEPKEGVRMFVGTASRNAVPREFGSIRSAAQPFMRPAWDNTKDEILEIVERELASEIEKTAARVAKRMAKK